MARKGRPKYPRKRTLSRKRLLTPLLLLTVAGSLWFYIAYNDVLPNDTMRRLGQSSSEVQEQPDSSRPVASTVQTSSSTAPGQSATLKTDASRITGQISRDTIPASPPPSHAEAASARKQEEDSAVSSSTPAKHEAVDDYPGESRDANAPADASEKNDDAAEEDLDAPGQSKDDGPGDMPYDGLTLAEVVAELGEKYKDTPSGAWGERVNGVTTRLDLSEENADSSSLVLALTLDACGGDYDAELVAFLQEKNIPATLFVTSLWLKRHQDTLRELAADPLFEIAAHGERHRPCSIDGKSIYGIRGTATMQELVSEVLLNAREITELTGKTPLWFRSGTAYYDELAAEVIQDLGMGIAGYSIAGDEGATLPATRVTRKTLQAKNGDILLLHMNKPRSGTREGLMQALPVLQKRGAQFVRLSDKY